MGSENNKETCSSELQRYSGDVTCARRINQSERVIQYAIRVLYSKRPIKAF